MLSKKDNGRGTATFLILPNEKPIFLENISTKDDAARRYFSKRTTDGAPHQMFMEMKDGEMIFNSEIVPQWFIEYVQSKVHT